MRRSGVTSTTLPEPSTSSAASGVSVHPVDRAARLGGGLQVPQRVVERVARPDTDRGLRAPPPVVLADLLADRAGATSAMPPARAHARSPSATSGVRLIDDQQRLRRGRAHGLPPLAATASAAADDGDTEAAILAAFDGRATRRGRSPAAGTRACRTRRDEPGRSLAALAVAARARALHRVAHDCGVARPAIGRGAGLIPVRPGPMPARRDVGYSSACRAGSGGSASTSLGPRLGRPPCATTAAFRRATTDPSRSARPTPPFNWSAGARHSTSRAPSITGDNGAGFTLARHCGHVTEARSTSDSPRIASIALVSAGSNRSMAALMVGSFIETTSWWVKIGKSRDRNRARPPREEERARRSWSGAGGHFQGAQRGVVHFHGAVGVGQRLGEAGDRVRKAARGGGAGGDEVIQHPGDLLPGEAQGRPDGLDLLGGLGQRGPGLRLDLGDDAWRGQSGLQEGGDGVAALLGGQGELLAAGVVGTSSTTPWSSLPPRCTMRSRSLTTVMPLVQRTTAMGLMVAAPRPTLEVGDAQPGVHHRVARELPAERVAVPGKQVAGRAR